MLNNRSHLGSYYKQNCNMVTHWFMKSLRNLINPFFLEQLKKQKSL